MKKAEQLAINAHVLDAIKAFNYDNAHSTLNWHRLRSCSAEVAQIENWIVLRSYNTIVAVIHRESGILYDFLRYVYGYTSTSAQHISKFAHDYGCTNRLTYKEV